jgi:hypothetical protein
MDDHADRFLKPTPSLSLRFTASVEVAVEESDGPVHGPVECRPEGMSVVVPHQL